MKGDLGTFGDTWGYFFSFFWVFGMLDGWFELGKVVVQVVPASFLDPSCRAFSIRGIRDSDPCHSR